MVRIVYVGVGGVRNGRPVGEESQQQRRLAVAALAQRQHALAASFGRSAHSLRRPKRKSSTWSSLSRKWKVGDYAIIGQDGVDGNAPQVGRRPTASADDAVSSAGCIGSATASAGSTAGSAAAAAAAGSATAAGSGGRRCDATVPRRVARQTEDEPAQIRPEVWTPGRRRAAVQQPPVVRPQQRLFGSIHSIDSGRPFLFRPCTSLAFNLTSISCTVK